MKTCPPPLTDAEYSGREKHTATKVKKSESMIKQNILCPVDFSGSSAPAVSLAARLAAAEASKVYLLHVNEPNAMAMSLDEASENKFRTRLADQFLNQRNIDFEHGGLNLESRFASVFTA